MKNTLSEIDLSFNLKSIDNLPNKKKHNKVVASNINSIKIKDFYLEIANNIDSITQNKLWIKKNLIDRITFYEMEELIQNNCINCLANSNGSWYKIKIYKADTDTFQIQILEKVKDIKQLENIHYLNQTIKKLKQANLTKDKINKYISNFMEYNCMDN